MYHLLHADYLMVIIQKLLLWFIWGLFVPIQKISE